MIQQFDYLKTQFRDTVFLINCTVYSKSLKCGIAYIMGNIPAQQALFDEQGNRVCVIQIPLDAATCPTFSLFSSPEDDIVFDLVDPCS